MLSLSVSMMCIYVADIARKSAILGLDFTVSSRKGRRISKME
jgi:hypothetical protein